MMSTVMAKLVHLVGIMLWPHGDSGGSLGLPCRLSSERLELVPPSEPMFPITKRSSCWPGSHRRTHDTGKGKNPSTRDYSQKRCPCAQGQHRFISIITGWGSPVARLVTNFCCLLVPKWLGVPAFAGFH